ncbi:NnrS family protein [Moraxella sp. FZLJ2107]|uniref:NnrS family protein n=1 Tax=unclassified Moraxella TaxID=2685852 RepID=UPI0020C8A9FA|nr:MULTISPECIES: NnrS family protein [unclassified Moraxella]UTO06016.1 NnrS family protein [Moraxella sp. FZLJ2107]UTO22753.1 NnrS family protein [Moraxella sp. FZLJ2109]
MLINIAKPQKSPHPLLNLGFRVFFLSSAVFAIITMLLWHYALIVSPSVMLKDFGISLFYWHGHEMVFGYALAVIAGFLLTAVKAWTSVPMPVGWKLFGIYLPWLVARVLFAAALFIADDVVKGVLLIALMADVIFWALVTAVVTRAVWLVRQKRQAGIVAKLVLLLLCQLGFLLASSVGYTGGQWLSLYVALFLVIGVVLTIGRRVLPFFIEKGVTVGKDRKPTGEQVSLPNAAWRDRMSLVSFVVFVIGFLADVPWLLSLGAAVCAFINAWRLIGWHHHGIWIKPLLWSLYLSFWGMVAAFVMLSVTPILDLPINAGVHLLALTGIGMMTVAMMARVSLGHTGRNIHEPPRLVGVMFALMIGCVLVRSALPLFVDDYMALIAYAQGLWMICFVLFVIGFGRMLMQPRVDGVMG